MCQVDTSTSGEDRDRLLTSADVEELQRSKSLVFVLDRRVYQLPDTFLHPGGDKVLRAHTGQDVSAVFRGAAGAHAHSASAYWLLQRYQIGTLVGGVAMASREQPVESASSADVDYSRPLAAQVGHLGDRYAQWVHEPEAGSPRFFGSGLVEAFTKTPWYVVPLIWAPVASASLWASRAGDALPWAGLLLLFALGFGLWHLTEYMIHRFVFHREPNSYWGVTLHFLMHGCHHKFPMDELRLVFPLILAAPVALLMYTALSAAMPQSYALATYAGWLAGYTAYDCFHYAIHHGGGGSGGLAPALRSYVLAMRSKHMDHHFRQPNLGFGISSNVLDVAFGTLR